MSGKSAGEGPDIHVQKILARFAAGDLMEAQSDLVDCLKSPPKSAASCCDLADIALSLNQVAIARAFLMGAMTSAPSAYRPNFLLGLVAWREENYTAARECFSFAARLPGSDATSHYHLSMVCEELGDLTAAYNAASRALEMEPEDADYQNQVACVLTQQGKHDLALGFAETAHRHEPEAPGFAWNLAQAYLQQGRWVEGWSLFEARLAFLDQKTERPSCQRWSGNSLDQKNLLVWSEQGLGDTLQFSRFLTALPARSVIFRCQPEVVSIMAKALPQIEVISSIATLPATDYHIPLLSLPGLQGYEGGSLPTSIFVSEAKPTRTTRLRVGFAWAGNKNHPDDARRSTTMENFSVLFSTPCDWVSFQKPMLGALPAGMEDRGSRLGNFEETAEALRDCDLVISVDTAVSHLSASHGIPTWLLLPFAPDWRWGLKRDLTAWYPSMRLFRQRAPGDWTDVFARVKSEILKIL